MLCPHRSAACMNHKAAEPETFQHMVVPPCLTIMDASAMLQSALCMVFVLALAGCGMATGGVRGDPQPQVAEPTCYRDTKTEYEAAGASQSPNTALLNIGASLAAKDNGFGKCLPAADEKNRIN